jgi:hypothetical protein
MQNITIGRFESDPEAQGVIRPEDDSWQLVIDKEGYPHLYVQSNIEEEEGGPTVKGLFCLEDALPRGMSVKEIMLSTFGGKLSPEEEELAQKEYEESRTETRIPCAR